MPEHARLDRAFFSCPAERLARKLLGALLVRVLDDGTRLSGIIVETEAYCGVRDQASHAFAGRRTPRNEAMYAVPGTAYVYFTYGMHFCMNVVCGKLDEPPAVLIRALEPVDGVPSMHRLRGKTSGGRPRPVRDLCNGPGKLAQALLIDRSLNGADLVTSPSIFLEEGPPGSKRRIRRTARIGLNNAGPWTHKPLRWLVDGDLHVSRARPPRPVREV